MLNLSQFSLPEQTQKAIEHLAEHIGQAGGADQTTQNLLMSIQARLTQLELDVGRALNRVAEVAGRVDALATAPAAEGEKL